MVEYKPLGVLLPPWADNASAWIVGLRASVRSPLLGKVLFPDYVSRGAEVALRFLYSGDRSGAPRDADEGGMSRAAICRQVIIPYAREALESQFMADLDQLVAGTIIGDEGDVTLGEPLSREEESRGRYCPQSRHAWAGVRFGPAFSLLEDVTTGAERALLSRVLSGLALQVGPATSEDAFRKRLKEISAWAKREGDLVTGWRALVSLDTLGNYRAPLTPDQLRREIVDWVQGADPCVPGYHLEGWYEHFLERLDKYFSRGAVSEAQVTPFRVYVESGAWARAGTSDVRLPDKHVFDHRGGRIKYRPTKDAVSLALSTDELIAMVESNQGQIAKALIKRETTKSRSVIISDLSLHIVMSWVAEHFERAAAGSKSSTLFMRPGQIREFWGDMIDDMRIGDKWAVPMDQSKFDYNVAIRQLSDSIKAMGRYLPACMAWAVNYITDRLVKWQTTVLLPDGSEVAVNKGLLSGWRVTSIFGTAINEAETEGSLDWLVERDVLTHAQRGSTELRTCYQGDDVRFLCSNPMVGVAVCEVLRVAGLDINPGKTWVSFVRDEFLRKVSVDGKLTGYPARQLGSIMSRNPIRPEPLGPVGKAREAVTRWMSLLGRTEYWGGMVRHMLSELKSIFRGAITPSGLANWVNSPVWAGGCGYTGRMEAATEARAVVMPAGSGKTTIARRDDRFIDIDWFIFPPKGTGPRLPYRFYCELLRCYFRMRPDAILLCHDADQAAQAGCRVVAIVTLIPASLQRGEKWPVAEQNLAKAYAYSGEHTSVPFYMERTHARVFRRVLSLFRAEEPLYREISQPPPVVGIRLGKGWSGVDEIVERLQGQQFSATALDVVKQGASLVISPHDPLTKYIPIDDDGSPAVLEPWVYRRSLRQSTLVRRRRGRKVIEDIVRTASQFTAIYLPPVTAGFRAGGPAWAKRVACAAEVRETRPKRTPNHVLAMLDERSKAWSDHIYRHHGRATWIRWVVGNLGLTVRPWAGWDPAYLSGLWNPLGRGIVRRALASSVRMRGGEWDLVNEVFWRRQQDPISSGQLLVSP